MYKEKLEKIRKLNPFASLHDCISEVLLRDLLTFKIKPGERLVETGIAASFGVSRSPVKLALAMLCEKGYLYKQDGLYYAKKLSLKEFQDLYDLSSMIEPYAAGRAATRLTEAQLQELRDMALELRALYNSQDGNEGASSLVKLMKMEYKFHSYIMEAADNEAVLRIFNDYIYHIFRYRSFLLQKPPMELLDMLANDHLLIVDTLSLRNQEMAEAVLKRHLSVSQHIIQDRHMIDRHFQESEN